MLADNKGLISSFQSLHRFGRQGRGERGGGKMDDSAQILFQSFSARGHCKQDWYGQEQGNDNQFGEINSKMTTVANCVKLIVST